MSNLNYVHTQQLQKDTSYIYSIQLIVSFAIMISAFT